VSFAKVKLFLVTKMEDGKLSRFWEIYTGAPKGDGCK
jgi:hypothetical protein